jgi:hypothetical protein
MASEHAGIWPLWVCPDSNWTTPAAYREGWRYVAPVATTDDVEAVRAEVARMKKAASTINEEVCQTLGAALGYPWLKDDQTNFPGATEADGVCVGPHVAETLAAEAAAKLATVAALVEALDGLVMACELPGDHCEREQALPAAHAALAAYREAGR